MKTRAEKKPRKAASRKTTSEIEAVKAEPPKEAMEGNVTKAAEPESALPIEEPETPQTPAQDAESKNTDGSKSGSAMFKIGAVVILAFITIGLAYVILDSAKPRFVPGTPVDQATFANLLADADKVYVMMDIRGVTDPKVQQSIMQCGVDFSGSSGTADKILIPLAVDGTECVTPDGASSAQDCFAMLSDGMAIYIVEGEHTYFHSNGMVVGVGAEYVSGMCSINRV